MKPTNFVKIHSDVSVISIIRFVFPFRIGGEGIHPEDVQNSFEMTSEGVYPGRFYYINY
jgi:hypothetical protein